MRMNAWGQYSNPPSQESAEMKRHRELHYLWGGAENFALPLTFKGEASMELLEWWFNVNWPSDSRVREKYSAFPSREQWLAMSGAELKLIAEGYEATKSGTKLQIYNRILERILRNLPSNLYLPIEELSERIPIFPYTLDSDKISKLYLDTTTNSEIMKDMLKLSYWTPQTFQQLLKWYEKMDGGIREEDGDDMVFDYYTYHLNRNPHFDLNLLLLPKNTFASNDLAIILFGNDRQDGLTTNRAQLLKDNQLLTLELLETVFGFSINDSTNDIYFIAHSNEEDEDIEMAQSLVRNPCVPTSLIRLAVQKHSEVLDEALENPNLSSTFIREVWEELTPAQLEVLCQRNHFIPRELIHSLFGMSATRPTSKWNGYALKGYNNTDPNNRRIFDYCLRQYHFPLEILQHLKEEAEGSDYLVPKISSFGKVNFGNDPDSFGKIKIIHLSENPNPELLEYALENFSVFLKGSSPRYQIAQNPSLTPERIKKHYSDFDGDDVSRNPALTPAFIKEYWETKNTVEEQWAGLSNWPEILTANTAFFPYDPTSEWASGLFNWRF
jgi:hypothetical protein